MATIEERAIESQRLHKDESKRSFNKENASFSEWCFGYCQGATEERKRVINEVCQWLEREYAYNGSMAVIDDELIGELRKEISNV